MKNLFVLIFTILASLLNAQQNDSGKVEIKNMGSQINSPFIDYAPLISADASILVYTSRKPISENKTKNLKDNIYRATYDSQKNEWSAGVSLSSIINIPGRNNSAISISGDGQQMLIYRDELNTNGDIYETHLNGSDWSEPVSLGEPVNSDDKEPSACISPDGQIIYFVSNRPGGLGGLDIWYCIKNDDGKWGGAVNAGAPVNSPEDEEGVFIHSDGKTLFFSSKGHNSTGGFDIFMSAFDANAKTWSQPLNLGTEINTTGDDLYFVMESNGIKGYYSSVRPGGFGEDDVYSVTFSKSIMDVNLKVLKGRVLNKQGNPVEAKITVKDKSSGKIIGTFTSNRATGDYLISLPGDKNYELIISADEFSDYVYSSSSSNMPGATEVIEDVVLEPRTETTEIKDSAIVKKTEEETPRTVEKKLSDVKPSGGDLNPTIYGRILDQNGNPLKVQIEVIDNNTNRVVGKYQTSSTTGVYSLKIKGGNYHVVFSKPCYLFQSVDISTSNTPGFKKDLKDITMEEVGIGKKIILGNILFDYTKASLREQSFFTLDRIIKLMNSMESLEIEISGHTDNVSSAEFNQGLSEERAKSVMKYMVRMGIDEERIKYKGYGLTQPIATNDNEAGRQLNRRTELKVLNVDLPAEQIKEIKRMKELILADSQLSDNGEKAELKRENQDSELKIPERFTQFDSNNDGKLASSEVIPVIDSFLDGSGNLSAEDITAFIDYFFEQ